MLYRASIGASHLLNPGLASKNAAQAQGVEHSGCDVTTRDRIADAIEHIAVAVLGLRVPSPGVSGIWLVGGPVVSETPGRRHLLGMVREELQGSLQAEHHYYYHNYHHY